MGMVAGNSLLGVLLRVSVLPFIIVLLGCCFVVLG